MASKVDSDKSSTDHLDGRQIRCPVDVILFICPTPDCGSHYASPNFRPDKANIDEPQIRRTEEGNRKDGPSKRMCPECRIRGKIVARQPYLVIDVMPLDI